MKLRFTNFIGMLFFSTFMGALAVAGNEGGGGELAEQEVDSIRADLLTWIQNGGAIELKLPARLSYEEYKEKMTSILRPRSVAFQFIYVEDPNNEELQVRVNGVPKTCRGFISKFDFAPHIICDFYKYNSLSVSEKYTLLHHEYAGLAQVELNDGAYSDYEISSQLGAYLSRQANYRLEIRRIKYQPIEGVDEKVIDFDIKQSFGCALTDQGRVICFKDGAFPDDQDVLYPPLDLKNVSEMEINQSTGCVKSDGNIRCWGNNADFIEAATKNWVYPEKIVLYRTEIGGRSAETHLCAVTYFGIKCTGPTTPVIPEGLTNPEKLFVKRDNMFVENLVICGLQKNKFLCSKGLENSSYFFPKFLREFNKIIDIDLDFYEKTNGCVIGESIQLFKKVRTLKCWGYHLNFSEEHTNAEIVSYDEGLGCKIDGSKHAKCYGSNMQQDETDEPKDLQVTSVKTTERSNCALTTNGKLYCWSKYRVWQYEVPEFIAQKNI